MTYLWLLLVVPVAWFIQNCIHEGSHLFFGWLIEGRKPLEFKPWPHMYERRFYFARCTGGPATKDGFPHIRHAGPILVNGPYMMLTSGLMILHIAFGILTLCALVDTLFWLYGFFWGSEFSDGKRFRKAVNEKL